MISRRQIRDTDLVINTIVGDTQRLMTDAAQGWAAEQHMSEFIVAAYWHLVKQGYDSRVVRDVRPQ